MKPRHLLAASILAMCCTRSSTDTQELGTSVRVVPSPAARPLVLTQVSLLPGVTAVDPSAAFVVFRSDNVDRRDAIAPMLGKAATFVADTGDVLPAVATLKSVKMPPEGLFVQV